jgi:hypothetical protein
VAEPRDLKVEPVDLGQLGINAGDHLGMVIGQPLFEVTTADIIKVEPRHRHANLATIQDAFRIREAEISGRGPVPFIIFPEFALPVGEPDGLDCVRKEIEQAPGALVFIAGMEWVTPQELVGLAGTYNTTAPKVSQGEFVNCCVVAVKNDSGQIRWYLQAKLFPAAAEQRRSMARGEVVYYFHTARCGFVVQICFDQIAASGFNDLGPLLLKRIADLPAPVTKRLDYIFVPQYNDAPNAASFKESTLALVSTRVEGLSSEGVTVVAVNRASASQDTQAYGCSGFHYQNRWQVPDNDSTNGYALTKSKQVTSAIFRKRTAAIHVAGIVPWLANTGRPGNPRSPLEDPRSYIPQGATTICDKLPCACVPKDNTPTGAYVSCGALPCILRTHLTPDLPTTDPARGRWNTTAPGYAARLLGGYEKFRGQLFVLLRSKAEQIIDVLFCQRMSGRGNPDTWEDDEQQALREWASTLSVLETNGDLVIPASTCVTASLGDAHAFAIADGANSHYMLTVDRYLARFGDVLWEGPSWHRRIVLVILRSRGLISPVVKKHRDVTEPRTADPDSSGGERPAYLPRRMAIFICKDLFDEVRAAADPLGKLNEELGKLNG